MSKLSVKVEWSFIAEGFEEEKRPGHNRVIPYKDACRTSKLGGVLMGYGHYDLSKVSPRLCRGISDSKGGTMSRGRPTLASEKTGVV